MRVASLALACSIGATAAVTAILPLGVEASVVVALSLEQLTVEAEDVWTARCVAQASRYDDRGRIVTDLTLDVGDSMKGRHRPGEQVVLTVLGGVVGDVGMRVPGEARLPVGHEAVVFAERGRDGRRRTVGMAQGVLPITRAAGRATVHPGGDGVHLVRGGSSGRTHRARSALPRPVALEELRASILAIVEAERTGSR